MPNSPINSPSSIRHTILIIESNTDVAELLKLIFEEAGFTPIALGNMEGTPEKAVKINPDVIVMDGTDNPEVFRKLRHMRTFDAIPIGLIDLHINESTYTRSMLPFDAYVNRPFSREELISMVRDMIAAKKALEGS